MSWFVKVIRSGARDADGNLPAEVWREGGVVPTLNVFDNTGDSRATVLVFDTGFHGDGIRISEQVVPTLQARMGTGGNNTPMVTHPIQGNAIGREPEHGPGGKGFGDEADPMFTLTKTDVHGVAYPINTLTLGGRPDPVNDARMTLGVGEDGDPQFTISANHPHAVAFTQNQRDEVRDLNGITGALQAEPGMKQQTFIADVSPTLTAFNMDSRSPQSEESQRIVGAVHQATSIVRRLTPTECERLQGFPDNWTEGQADSHRYKQMGNAVAVPVVEWVMARLVEQDKGN